MDLRMQLTVIYSYASVRDSESRRLGGPAPSVLYTVTHTHKMVVIKLLFKSNVAFILFLV